MHSHHSIASHACSNAPPRPPGDEGVILVVLLDIQYIIAPIIAASRSSGFSVTHTSVTSHNLRHVALFLDREKQRVAPRSTFDSRDLLKSRFVELYQRTEDVNRRGGTEDFLFGPKKAGPQRSAVQTF